MKFFLSSFPCLLFFILTGCIQSNDSVQSASATPLAPVASSIENVPVKTHQVEFRITGNAKSFAVAYFTLTGEATARIVEPTQITPLWRYKTEAKAGQKVYFNAVIAEAVPDEKGVDQSELELQIWIDGKMESESSAFQKDNKGEAEFLIP